jgi:hypothetical protein
MHKRDRRPEHLGWIEAPLRAADPDLPYLDFLTGRDASAVPPLRPVSAPGRLRCLRAASGASNAGPGPLVFIFFLRRQGKRPISSPNAKQGSPNPTSERV